MKYICPLIVVEDLERAKKFYMDVMKQKVRYDYGENITFYGDFSIHQKAHYQSLLEGVRIIARSHSFELYFEFDDVDAFFANVHEKIEIIHPPREQPWRQKVMRFYDPDGHVLEVGEALDHTAYRLLKEGLSADQVAAILTMPLDFVQNAGKIYHTDTNQIK